MKRLRWKPNPEYDAKMEYYNNKLAEMDELKAQLDSLRTEMVTDASNLQSCYDCLQNAIVDPTLTTMFEPIANYAATYRSAIAELDDAYASIKPDVAKLKAEKAAVPRGWWVWE